MDPLQVFIVFRLVFHILLLIVVIVGFILILKNWKKLDIDIADFEQPSEGEFEMLKALGIEHWGRQKVYWTDGVAESIRDPENDFSVKLIQGVEIKDGWTVGIVRTKEFLLGRIFYDILVVKNGTKVFECPTNKDTFLMVEEDNPSLAVVKVIPLYEGESKIININKKTGKVEIS